MSTNPTTQEQATMLPAIGQRWPGVDGQYIGVTTDPSGELCAVVVLDARPDRNLTWSEAREWAASVGGALPTRPEGAMAFANVPQAFEKRWHWLDEQTSARYAWDQYFADGLQFYGVKTTGRRARAFRRLKLSPSALATQPQAQPTAAPALLESAIKRMDCARRILTDDNPRPECNWGMLDTADIKAALAQPLKQEPAGWQDEIEQRIRTWRQRFMNRSGDRLAIDDFMGQESIDDLVDFVCSPLSASPQQQDQPTAAQGPSLEQVQQALLAAGLSARFSYRLAFSVGYDYALSAQPQAAQAVPQDEKVVALYVASRASLPARPAMWRELRAQGWPIISSWIDEAGEGETEDLGELWQRITDEIRRSCGVILYAEAEDMPLKGALIECGIAIGMGKRVAAVLPGIALEPRSMRPVGSWLRHPLVSIHSTVHEARAALASPTTQAAGEQSEGGEA